VHNKGKRKIVNNIKPKQGCKFRADPLVQKEALVIEEKKQLHDKRNA